MSDRGALALPPRRFGKLWITLGRVSERTFSALGGRAFYRAAFLARGRFRLREVRCEVPDLPPGLDGLRVAQLSDLHAGRFLGAGDLADVVDAVNGARPDLVALTGDFITSHWSEVLGVVADLGRLRAPLGAFAVFGNHDYRGRLEGRIAEAFADVGIRTLRNEAVRLDTGDGVLAVTGLEDLEEARRVDVQGARRDLEPTDVELLLCHNPGRARDLAHPRCAAILSGHTHGNQIDLPGFRRFGPEHPGDLRRLGNTLAVTNLGLGVVGVPLRFGAPAEVVLLTLARA